MQAQGISRRNYERLPPETKSKITELFDEIRTDLQHYGISLRFLGLGGRWKQLNAPRFLAFPESHYRILISGSKWVTSTKRRDLVDQIAELYNLVRKARLNDTGLEEWLKDNQVNK
jgi:hypothetical protein